MTDREANPWRDYAKERPRAVGIFEWRLPSVSLPGALITFHAHVRIRGAGYREVISPAFDYWDGYRLHVPQGTQWREADPSVQCKAHEYANLAVEGLEFCACPYCGGAPRLHAIQRGAGGGGGVALNGDPHKLNTWWLECCAWGKTPHIGDPREIESIRRAAFARSAAAAIRGATVTAAAAAIRGATVTAAEAPPLPLPKQDFNAWWASLSEGRRGALVDEKWMLAHASYEAGRASRAQQPSVLYQPVLSKDGNQWCALYGANLQEGVAGFGDTPEEAMADFDRAWGAGR